MQLYKCITFFPLKTNVASFIPTVYSKVCQYWLDILLVVIFASSAGWASFKGGLLINPYILSYNSEDIWFGADVARVLWNMALRTSNHFRTEVHPLFSLIAYPPVQLLNKLGIEQITAARIIIASVASLWLSSVFVLLRLMGCRRFDATLFSVLAATSAAAVFWFVIPETFSFGSVSLLLALCFTVVAQSRKFSSLCYIGVSAMTLSVTTTNWMAGLVITIVNHPWKRALQITVNALCLVILLWSLEHAIFPTAKFFLGDTEEQNYILQNTSGGPLHIIQAFVAHTMIMPSITADHHTNHSWPGMVVQLSPPGSGSVWGSVGVVLWTALLALGLWSFFSLKQHLKFRIVLGLTLLGQLALHLVYGEETFLYAIHLIVFFIPLVALSTLTRWRPLALILAGMLALSAGVNNGLQFDKAIKFVDSIAPNRDKVLGQMQLRPNDPWSRGTGHVVLAYPGSLEPNKAYHEPGGSFSPSVGSFGVSFWVNDAQGNIKTTSDSIRESEINQQFQWNDGQQIPGILTKTPYYQTLWSSTKPGFWLLNLKSESATNTTLNMVIRSVGPAGGPIRSLDWNGQRLLINNRWSLTLNSPPTHVYLGEERQSGWKSDRPTITNWQDENGWGYARLELANGNDWNLVIQDTSLQPTTNVKFPVSAKASLKLNLPDQQFAASLNAQVAHIMMGLVEQQTRPGEPTNYPLTWQRHAAYQIVALARAGQLDVAKQLSTYLAENDFFGGFGPEADAPGLGIWALSEVATRLNQPDYDKWSWDHIRRKTEFILKMMSTDTPIHQQLNGKVLEEQEKDPDIALVAEPPRNGLIIGRVDNQRPLLYVNAISYRGLLDAASLADRLQQPADAKRWRDAAAILQQAWGKTFKFQTKPRKCGKRCYYTPESENDRTFINSLWPTQIAASNQDILLQRMETRWMKLRDAQGGFRENPTQTYFDIAEAHQWLFLNQSDSEAQRRNAERLWKTLQWFWNHQASTGLYTWWEGDGEVNTSHRWEDIRGWVKPIHVTPHYWSAAEMLLMQLDMLAYTDIQASQPTVVIGAGIPTKWLHQPMSVEGLPIPNGQLDWIWDGNQMNVKITGGQVNVKLGSVFPPTTPLKVDYVK
ncbi:hypothetical protein G7B40_009010 [Aetokthonos hydrillicola Thurmond2011]|jgi:hypothetical protein|uniref:Uncharacterized protein n=1 Tax=Aetokthonos hydrillicola Thurmond2011 TaxID=2712845 RepID=A0AAP5M8G5_9CYAN|nr:hypothetical protein [Aetokthonos hydrillicola]MBO3457611.1 hypothetical protein [Aetokthonos hydrillicola CCALA 1050]MBW4587889.1 hypothetical protein [Aetokthonos hydrillicola CCALA 1050]MDR9894707.1 hypothetical protein [Aetokthonos hydrillicola Thurmond2011]